MIAKHLRTRKKSRRLHAGTMVALLVTSAVLAACTSNKRNFDFPEPPIRRGSF